MSVSPGRWWAVLGLFGILALAAFLAVGSREDAGAEAEKDRRRDRTEPPPISTATPDVERGRGPKDATSKTFRVSVRDAATGEAIDGSARVLRVSRYGAEEGEAFEPYDVESWVVVLRSGARFWWKRLEAGHASDVVATLESPGAPIAILEVPRVDANAEIRYVRHGEFGHHNMGTLEMWEIAEELSWVGIHFSPVLEAAAWLQENESGEIGVALTAFESPLELGISFDRPARAERRSGVSFDVLEAARPGRDEVGTVVLLADPIAKLDVPSRFRVELATRVRARCPGLEDETAEVELLAIPKDPSWGSVRRPDRERVLRDGTVEFWAFPGDYGLVLEERLGLNTIRLAFLRVGVKGEDIDDLALIPEDDEMLVEPRITDEEGQAMAPLGVRYSPLRLELRGRSVRGLERSFKIDAILRPGKVLRLIGVGADEVDGSVSVSNLAEAFDPDAVFSLESKRHESDRLVLEYRRGSPPVPVPVAVTLPTKRSKPGAVEKLIIFAIGQQEFLPREAFSLSPGPDGTWALEGQVHRVAQDLAMVAVISDVDGEAGDRWEARLHVTAKGELSVLHWNRFATVRRDYTLAPRSGVDRLVILRPSAWSGTVFERFSLLALAEGRARSSCDFRENEPLVSQIDRRKLTLVTRPHGVEVRR